MNNYTLQMSITILTLCTTTISFSMFTTYNIHNKRQYLQKKDLSFSEIIRKSNDAEREKSILLLKNEPEVKEFVFLDNILNPDTKYSMAEHLDFKTECAYWCTNKVNNIVGHKNWLKRENLHHFSSEDLDTYKVKTAYLHSVTGFDPQLITYTLDHLTAAVVTRSHEQLASLLKKREDLFSKGIYLQHLPFTRSMQLAKSLARRRIDNKEVEFFESKDHSLITIRQKNMAAIEMLLEHECRLHLIKKQSFQKLHNIKGYQEYLNSQGKAFLEEIMGSIDSNDLEYFKLLVKHIHPHIINVPMRSKYNYNEFRTTLDKVSDRVLWSTCIAYCEPAKHTPEFLQALSPFLIRHGALTYEELMVLSTQQDKNYGFKLPQDYHETGFIIKDEANQTCYWVNPNLLLDNAK